MIEVTGMRERRRKQLMDDRKERREFWKLIKEALARTLWRACSGRGHRPFVRKTTEWIK